MIVLMLSLREVDGLLANRADKALKDYLARSCAMEAVLPDDRLPVRVMLEQVQGTEREYVAVLREFLTVDDADEAWKNLPAIEPFKLTA